MMRPTLFPIVAIVVSCACSVLAGSGLYTGPYFQDAQTLNITIHQDAVAYLPCVVRQLGNKQVGGGYVTYIDYGLFLYKAVG